MKIKLNNINTVDKEIIHSTQRWGMPLARVAIFTVYFWFGILKLFNYSPANPLVDALLRQTLPFITFDVFIMILGVYEILIAIVFLIPGLERIALPLLVPHLFVTTAPLFLLREITWQAPLIPTIEGQYIIKNILIVATAVGIAAHLHPMKRLR
jgi:uncharacterized membrane protein YkgB